MKYHLEQKNIHGWKRDEKRFPVSRTLGAAPSPTSRQNRCQRHPTYKAEKCIPNFLKSNCPAPILSAAPVPKNQKLIFSLSRLSGL
ncbi:MAG TPA: hypothetical protein PKY10_16295, partial [Lentisphaeria bacterium]|nr:hypothetical protein [Lentisphaeria bacterium]